VAMAEMARAVGSAVERYAELSAKARRCVETELFNGSYFVQKVGHRSIEELIKQQQLGFPGTLPFTPEAVALMKQEGPLYQFGNGCLSWAAAAEWSGWTAGIDSKITEGLLKTHLDSVYRYNFRRDLSDVAVVCRFPLGCGGESGLLNCTWPAGDRPSLPEFYSNEVWTGIEYQVAARLIAFGATERGLEIVRACRRRYDGVTRNPFSEAEAGDFYFRASCSYSLLQALSGARYDAVDQVLYLKPAIKGDFRCFISTATGYGTVGVKSGTPFLTTVQGNIPYRRIDYVPAA